MSIFAVEQPLQSLILPLRNSGVHCLLGSAGPVTIPSVLEPYVQPLLQALESAAPEPLTRYAQLNWAALFGVSYWCYYAVLDHVAAVSVPMAPSHRA